MTKLLVRAGIYLFRGWIHPNPVPRPYVPVMDVRKPARLYQTTQAGEPALVFDLICLDGSVVLASGLVGVRLAGIERKLPKVRADLIVRGDALAVVIRAEHNQGLVDSSEVRVDRDSYLGASSCCESDHVVPVVVGRPPQKRNGGLQVDGVVVDRLAVDNFLAHKGSSQKGTRILYHVYLILSLDLNIQNLVYYI